MPAPISEPRHARTGQCSRRASSSSSSSSSLLAVCVVACSCVRAPHRHAATALSSSSAPRAPLVSATPRASHALVIPGLTPATQAVADAVHALLLSEESSDASPFVSTVLPEAALESRLDVRAFIASAVDDRGVSVTHVVDCRFAGALDDDAASDVFLETINDDFQIWCTVAPAMTSQNDEGELSWAALEGSGLAHRYVRIAPQLYDASRLPNALLDDVLARAKNKDTPSRPTRVWGPFATISDVAEAVSKALSSSSTTERDAAVVGSTASLDELDRAARGESGKPHSLSGVLADVAPGGAYAEAFGRRVSELDASELSAAALRLDALVAPSAAVEDVVREEDVLVPEEDLVVSLDEEGVVSETDEEDVRPSVADVVEAQVEEEEEEEAPPVGQTRDGPPGSSPVVAVVDAAATKNNGQQEEYEGRTVAELKDVLRARKLKLSGKKADLIQRLREYDDTVASPPPG